MASFTPAGTAFDVTGPEGAPFVILVHGLGLTAQTWDQHVPALAEDHRVVRYDLIGHGSTPPTDATLDLTSFSQQVVELADHVGIERAAVVGFSLGGMINRRLAMDHPDRVAALVILNSPHERDPEAQRLVEERAAASAEGGPGANIDSTLERWFTPEFRTGHADVVALVRNWVLANEPEPYAAARTVLAAGVIELIRPSPPIVHPALVMTCEHDSGSTPEMSEAIGTEIAGAEVVIVPELQHLGLIERPELFTDPMLRFFDHVFDGEGR